MFIEPKSSFTIIFMLIITRIKQIELQIYYFVFFKEVSIKKKNFELKTLKFFIVYDFH